MIWKNIFVFIFSDRAPDPDLGSSVQPESGACCTCCWSWGSEILNRNIMSSVDVSAWSHLSRVSIFCSSQSWEWRLGSPWGFVIFFSSLSVSDPDRFWQLSLSLLHSSWSFRAHIVQCYESFILSDTLWDCKTLQNIFQSNGCQHVTMECLSVPSYINLIEGIKEMFTTLCGQGNLSRHRLGSSF